MKAPDKIYIQTNKGEAFSSKWTTVPFRDFENAEYIHKEALLEWAKERYKSTISNVGCYTGHSVWAEVVEKLESL